MTSSNVMSNSWQPSKIVCRLDLDYEKYPDQHCVKAAELLRDAGVDEFYIHGVCSYTIVLSRNS